MSLELKDWLNSINTTKEDLSEFSESYQPYLINKCLSSHLDAVLFTNELNQLPYLDKTMQYLYYLYALRPKKRYAPWLKKGMAENVAAIKEYYGYSDKKAMDALKILNRDEINFIKQRLNKGGIKK